MIRTGSMEVTNFTSSNDLLQRCSSSTSTMEEIIKVSTESPLI